MPPRITKIGDRVSRHRSPPEIRVSRPLQRPRTGPDAARESENPCPETVRVGPSTRRLQRRRAAMPKKKALPDTAPRNTAPRNTEARNIKSGARAYLDAAASVSPVISVVDADDVRGSADPCGRYGQITYRTAARIDEGGAFSRAAFSGTAVHAHDFACPQSAAPSRGRSTVASSAGAETCLAGRARWFSRPPSGCVSYFRRFPAFDLHG